MVNRQKKLAVALVSGCGCGALEDEGEASHRHVLRRHRQRGNKGRRRTPKQQAVAELATKIAKDDQWYPGKVSADAKKRGPKKKFTRAKQLQVAKTAMALKRSGAEVSVVAVLARAPKATTNPKTGQLYTAPTISKVFKNHCFDGRG